MANASGLSLLCLSLLGHGQAKTAPSAAGEWRLDPIRTSQYEGIFLTSYNGGFLLRLKPGGDYVGGMLGDGRWAERGGSVSLSPKASNETEAQVAFGYRKDANAPIVLERGLSHGLEALTLRRRPHGGRQDLVRVYVRGTVGAVPKTVAQIEWLYFAILSHSASVAKDSLRRGADPNGPHPAIRRLDGVVVTPLSAACRRNELDVVRLLLEAGANPNLPSGPSRKTPLMRVAQKNPALIGLLRAHGADPRKKDAKGKSALDLAREGGVQKVIVALTG